MYRLSPLLESTTVIDTQLEKVESMKAVSYQPETRNSQHR